MQPRDQPVITNTIEVSDETAKRKVVIFTATSHRSRRELAN